MVTYNTHSHWNEISLVPRTFCRNNSVVSSPAVILITLHCSLPDSLYWEWNKQVKILFLEKGVQALINGPKWQAIDKDLMVISIKKQIRKNKMKNVINSLKRNFVISFIRLPEILCSLLNLLSFFCGRLGFEQILFWLFLMSITMIL